MDAGKLSYSRLSADQRRAVYALLRKQGVDVLAHAPIERVPRDRPVVASAAQRRLWVFWKLQPESTAYHISGALRVRGALDVAAAERALAAVVARHDALRSSFVEQDGVPLQRVHESLPSVLARSTLDRFDAERVRERVSALADEPFDLTRGPLLRCALIECGAGDAVFAITLHHIVADAWSLELILREFATAYLAARSGKHVSVPPLRLQYPDYAAWQDAWLTAGEGARQLAYHRSQLAAADVSPLPLPFDRPRPSVQSHRGAVVERSLSETTALRLSGLARAESTTSFTLLLAAYAALLYRITGRRELVIGIPIANRNRAEMQDVVGFFVNTLALPIALDGRMHWHALIDRVKRAMSGAQANAELPFDQLVDALKPERSLSHNPLFQVMFNHLREREDALGTLGGLQLEPLKLPATSTQFELTLDAEEDALGRVALRFEYATDVFDRETVERWATAFSSLARALAEDPSRRIADCALARAEAGGLAAERFEPVAARIARSAACTPQALALACGQERVSFSELQCRAVGLAYLLRERGVSRDQIVAVACERTSATVLHLLAVWHAGGAFLPLDPALPEARLREMIESAGARWLIAEESLQLPAAVLEGVERIAPRQAAANDRAIERTIHPDQLAYVLFTSGSTGRPKPVAVSHGALASHLAAMRTVYRLGPDERWLQFSSFSFDASIEQWALPLAEGASVVVRPEQLWSERELLAVVESEQLTRLDLPPSYASAFAAELAARGGGASLRSCTVGGEALPRESLAVLRRALGERPLYNAYGPTEAVITPLLWTAAEADSAYAPIGRSLGRRRAYVLDQDWNAAPAGVSGELYVAGDDLARGYLGRPRETAERFVPDAFGNGTRMYRTGDRVRAAADGTVVYLGRLDDQIKLRGYRIELGELEAALGALPGVRESAARVEEQHLLAYVAGTPELQGSQLRAALAASLPSYMVPAQVLVVPQLPRTANGKLDVAALPKPTWGDAAGEAAQGDVEQALCELFASVLGVTQVFRDSNFFALGGDSISSLQLCSRARDLGYELHPRQVFEHQSPRELAAVAGRASAEAEPADVAQGEVSLTPIQADFFASAIPEPHHYNQSLLLRSDRPLDVVALERAVTAIVEQHAALRLRFELDEDGVRQRYVAHSGGELQHMRVHDTDELTARCEAAQRSLDLAHGPLFRALHIELEGGGERLLLVAHHLVVDGVSWRILLEDLARAYAGSTLPRASASYGRWSARLSDYAASAELDPERVYWRARAAQPALQLPAANEATLATRAGRALTRLDRNWTELLLRRAPIAYGTQGAELLLAALAPVLCAHVGGDAVWIELESHGREHPFAELDVSRTVGWFTALYPLALRAETELASRIKHTKEALRSAQSHALSYALVQPSLQRPGLTFNYLGQFDASLGEGALLSLAGEDKGSDQSPECALQNGLELNGQVYGGELELVWSFDPTLYDAREVEALASAYEAELRALIEHCGRGVRLGLTPSDVPLASLGQSELDRLPLPAAEIEDLYPLTPMQQGMLFHEVDAPEQGTYVNQLDVAVEGLDVVRLAAAWRMLLVRQPILRTAFVWEGGLSEPLQLVARSVDGPFEREDLRALGPDELPAALDALRTREHARGFELSRAPLARFVVVDLPDGRHQLIWTTHHLLLDGWSNALLLGELLRGYAGELVQDPAPAFRRYVSWLAARPRGDDERFWRAQLQTVSEPTFLAGSVAAPERSRGRGLLRRSLDAKPLREFGQRERVTLGTLLEAAWAIVLAAYTGREQVAFGVTVSGRPSSLPGVERMLGLFINTIPSLQRVAADAPVGEYLRALQRSAAERREHEHTPLVSLARWAGQPGKPLFDTLLVVENYPVDETLSAAGGGLRFGPTQSRESTDYAVTLSVSQGAMLELNFEYAREHFDEAAIAQLSERLLRVLEKLAAPNVRRVRDASLLTEADEQRLRELRAPARRRGQVGFIHEWIGQRAVLAPAATALVCGDARLSYGELERRANQLAQRLSRLGVGPEQRVGVALPRSVELLVAVLGVLKAGAAYVPLDLSYPEARLRFMASDAKLRAVIGRAELQLGGVPLVSIDDPTLRTEPAAAPVTRLHPDSAAYLIYTSGSTGQPKGVCVTHRALGMHLSAAAEIYRLTPEDSVLHLASISFDAAVEQWGVPLMSGAKLVLSGEQREAPDALYALAVRERLSLIYPPTSQLLALAEYVAGEGRSLRLRLCTVGGEAVPRAAIERLRASFAPERIINGYGPTEAVITPLLWQARPETPCPSAYAPIGALVGERSAWILDAYLEPVAPGLVGELYVAGPELARGYHARAALTAERFLPAPHSSGERMYRTGDLVRMLPDGQLEFVARKDEQLKLRGLRIEPAEIEAALLAQPGVREAVVALSAAPERRLLGWVAPHEPHELDERTLTEALRERLPAALVPSRIVILPALPRTPNGKIDRPRLPQPTAAERSSAAPQGDREQLLAELWQAVLSVPQVGRDDDFFALGGDSIVSIQLISRARQRGFALTTRQIFAHPRLSAQAAALRPMAAAELVEGPVSGAVPLTPIQAQFFAAPIPVRAHFNQALLLATRAPLERAPLLRAVDAVLAHHDALRMRYSGTRQRYAERPDAAEDVLWTRHARDAAELEALCQAAQRSLDLEHGPLVRVLHAQLDDGSERLLIAVHHLVIDGVSWRVLLEDLQRAYGCEALLPKTSSFQRYAERLRAFANAAALDDVAYWCAEAEPSPLPRDRDGELRSQRRVAIAFEPEFTERLLRESGRAFRTRTEELLLTALARTLCAYSDAPALRIELEGHGREDIAPDLDLSRTVGWFTSSFPLQLSPAADLGASIKCVKEQLRALPQRGLSFGALAHFGPAEIRAQLSALPRPEVAFNYLGQFDASFDAEQSLFFPARESSGDDVDPSAPPTHAFEINGEIVDRRLRFSWAYSPELHDAATVSQLAAAFERELRTLVDYCASHSASLTPSDVPLSGLEQAALDGLPPGIADVYPLTPLQKGMLFHALSAPEQDVYVTQLAVDLLDLDVDRFRAAWQAALDAHDTLRTSFVVGLGREPLQLVHESVELPFALHELSGRDSNELAVWAEAERARGFALDRAPLLRIALARTSEREHRLVWTTHHLLLDGWSSSLLLGEVLQRYHGQAVPSPTLRFRDYIGWLAARDAAAAERGMRAQLERLERPTLLGTPRASAPQGFASLRRDLPAALTRELERRAQREAVTLSTLVQAAWAIVLQRVSNQRAVVFGATVSGRPPTLPDVERVLGLFINTLPVVCAPKPEHTVSEWLRALQAQQLELREHEHTPLYDIQTWAGFGEALFDTLLVFENYPVAKALVEQCGGLRFEAPETHENTNYALTVGISHGEQLELGFEYRSDAFDAQQIGALAGGLARVLEQFADDPTQRIGLLGLQPVAALPVVDSPSFGGLFARIAEHARQHPERLALRGSRRQLSFVELVREALAIAGRLHAEGIGPEDLVGVALPRSPEAIVALLGVLSAGAGFVYLDPALPDAVTARLRKAARLRTLIGPDGIAPAEPRSRPPLEASVAYVLYTSGSTGEPKGVEVSYAALVRQCDAMAELMDVRAGERVLSFASLGFDASLEQWLMPLLHGASVHIVEELCAPAQLAREIQAHDIQHVDLPPAYARLVARELEEADARLALRCCAVGGEAVSSTSFAAIAYRFGAERSINAYGPTEAVITPAAWLAVPGAPSSAYAPIGRPLAERRAYVLDDQLQPLPPGAAGELFFGGGPLARGYRDMPARTAERWLPDPFGAPGGRMLRTGDRVRQRQDGTLEFLGRSDNQVKVRGFRIELGEIESALQRHPAVREAAVIARKSDEALELGAYAVADCDAETLLAYLRTVLPAHAVPSSLACIASIPRTLSGKLDARALPDIERPQRTATAPRTHLERHVAAAYAHVLGLEQVDVHDNFFELGGHSLRALALSSELERLLERHVPLADVLRHPTVESLAARLAGAAAARSAWHALNASRADAPPLFCVHPAGGTPFAYLPLARALAGRRTVYAAVCRSLFDPEHHVESLPQLAQDYTAALLELQPRGPYYVLGWSLGGAIALQIAAELEALGHEVRFLAFVDGFVPGLDDLAAPEPELPPIAADIDAFADIDRALAERTLQRLTELSRSYRLPRVRRAPHCYWSRDAGALRAQAEARLVHAIGTSVASNFEAATTHAQIMSDTKLLARVSVQLSEADAER